MPNEIIYRLKPGPSAANTWRVGPVPSAVYDTAISLASSLSGSAAGVTATATGGLDADEKFELNALVNPGGTPLTMVLNVLGSDALQVDFPGDYGGKPCRYTSKAGTRYDTTFQSGTVVL